MTPEKKYFIDTLMQQLGGKQFILFTGAKHFGYDPDKENIYFQIGRGAKNKINFIKITLNFLDLYDMKFFKIEGKNRVVVSEKKDIYFDKLQEIFTQETGFLTHF